MVQPVDITDQIYDALEWKIISGELSPGERIQQEQVSAELGVSRTLLMKALVKLEHDMFLQEIPSDKFQV